MGAVDATEAHDIEEKETQETLCESGLKSTRTYH